MYQRQSEAGGKGGWYSLELTYTPNKLFWRTSLREAKHIHEQGCGVMQSAGSFARVSVPRTPGAKTSRTLHTARDRRSNRAGGCELLVTCSAFHLPSPKRDKILGPVYLDVYLKVPHESSPPLGPRPRDSWSSMGSNLQWLRNCFSLPDLPPNPQISTSEYDRMFNVSVNLKSFRVLEERSPFQF